MTKQGFFEIVSNAPLTENVFKMELSGDTSAIISPGQFVNIKGTEAMSKMKNGRLDILSGLGNGYDMSLSGDSPLLIGGGVGVPPLYYLAKKLREIGKNVSVILGFNTRSEIFYEQEFLALGCSVTVTTVDGSYGVKGFVTRAYAQSRIQGHFHLGPVQL